MAFRFVSQHLLEDLLKIDIPGASGSIFAPSRCNLRMEISNRWFSEDDLVLEIQCYSPEGFGVEGFLNDSMIIPTEHMTQGTERMIWDVQKCMPPLRKQVWALNLLEIDVIHGKWDLGYLFDQHSTWMTAPRPSEDQTTLRCLELFAGAYGGWKGALEVLSHQQVPYQSVGIEVEERASKAYAISHYAHWLGPQVELPEDWWPYI